VLLVIVIGVALLRLERLSPVSEILRRLQDTTAQIRIRGTFLLLAGCVVLAQVLGLEVILGAFVAGAVLRVIDRDEMLTHPQFRARLDAIGFGVFVPFFFVASGLRFDLAALFADMATLARVPLFLVALLVVRALPAVLYRPLIGGRRAVAAGLLQATSLGFIVVAAQLGIELGVVGAATGSALIAAGLLSVLIFPLGALTVLGRRPRMVGSPDTGVGAKARRQALGHPSSTVS
jgi:Kef-type K+ transport system membrane component KefB